MSNAYNSNTNSGIVKAALTSDIVAGIGAGAAVPVKKQELNLEHLGLNEIDHGEEVRRLANQILQQADSFDPNTYGSVDNSSSAKDKSNAILDAISVSDTSKAEQNILDIINVTKTFSSNTISAGKPSVFKRMLGRGKQALDNQRQKYHSVSERVQAIEDDLVDEANELAKNNEIIEQQKRQNQDDYHATALRIAAGTMALNIMIDQANAIDGDGRVLGHTYRTAQLLHGLEKRLHDLQLTQVHRTQLAPQYEMLISNNLQLIDKYSSVGSLMIPAWRTGITMALTIQRSERSAKVLDTLTDATQEYMLANSKMMKETTINVTKISQRSIIDVSTLETIQRDLEEGMRSVLEIQREGNTKRDGEIRKLRTLQRNIQALAVDEIQTLTERTIAAANAEEVTIEQRVKESAK